MVVFSLCLVYYNQKKHAEFLFIYLFIFVFIYLFIYVLGNPLNREFILIAEIDKVIRLQDRLAERFRLSITDGSNGYSTIWTFIVPMKLEV